MVLFSQQIYSIVDSALTDLNNSQASGKTQRTDLSEAHYLGAWVTMAIKKKECDPIVLETLKGWQKEARSLGKNATLKRQFSDIKMFYNQVKSDDQQLLPINITQFDKLYAALDEDLWLVTTDLEVGQKLNRHSGGKDSLIVDAQQIANNFDVEGTLIKPISLYVRGNQQGIINLAFEENLLLHKRSDYKSKVKYHGEFIVYPDNDSQYLPEFPIK